jgi:hypothetical protein
MNAPIRDGIHKVAIALVNIWFNHSEGDWFVAYVYSRDLDTKSIRLHRKRIKVRIEIEDDPTWQIRGEE